MKRKSNPLLPIRGYRTAEQAAKVLGLSKKTLLRLTQGPLLDGYKYSNGLRFSHEQLEAYQRRVGR